ARTPMLDRATVASVLHGDRVRSTRPVGPDGESFHLLAIPAPKIPRSQVLVVAASMDGVSASMHRVLVLLLMAGPAVVAAAAAVGWWLSRKALLPVARMTERAAVIGMERLEERVPEPSADDELAQ